MAIILATIVTVMPRIATAQDFATRSAARKLGEEGIVLFEKQQFAEALEKFNLAEQLVPAPTLGLRAARCLVQLGRFVEASERYLEVTRIEVPRAQMTPAFRKAQADALIERDQLLPLIPTLTIEVTGPTGAGVTVFVDGEQIPTALVGQKRPIDPGVHEVEVRRKDTQVKKKIDIVVKENEKLRLELPPLPEAKAPEVDPKLQVLGWVGIGVGVGGALAFAINGSLAVSKERDLIDKCPDRRCLPAFHAEANTYDMLRYATTAGIIASVVGVGVGLPLLITKPRVKAKKEAALFTVTPILGPTAVGLRGSF
ncbi:MAG: hypothetical protein IPM54_39250 [Polyangiaceae bacterium]|nr:hypothetical protein [Polyangiaceae bacterium]